VWGEAPEIRQNGYQNAAFFAYKTIVLLLKSVADAVHNAVRKRNQAQSAGSLSALPRGQACQQQPDMPASAYGCPHCAGARRGYHSTVTDNLRGRLSSRSRGEAALLWHQRYAHNVTDDISCFAAASFVLPQGAAANAASSRDSNSSAALFTQST
jgi:hypothetical protein